jgi:hypothetical protein
MSGRFVDVRIDELLLDGVAPRDRPRVADAATRELERLLGEESRAPASVDVVVEAVDVGRGSSVEQLGVEIARAVHRGLS